MTTTHAMPELGPADIVVDIVRKPMGGFAFVNTNGVIVTHKPSGIAVTVDAHKSMHENRQAALNKLRTTLATLQAQPADVSDAEISRLWSWSATPEAERTATTQQHAFAYALLALRPQSDTLCFELSAMLGCPPSDTDVVACVSSLLTPRPQVVPMTDERLAEVLTTAYGSPEWTMDDVRAARAVEAAALGIAAPAGGEGKA